MTERRRRPPRWLPYAHLSLTAPDEEAAPRLGALAGLRARWRWWMVLPLLLVLLAIGALVRVRADVVWPDEVVDAAQLVEVSVRGTSPARSPTGTFLTVRRSERPTVLGWLIAVAPGGATARPMAPRSIDHFDPLDSALLAGSGVAPGRGHAKDLGLSAVVRDERTPVSDPAIALYVFDVVSPQDLAAHRRVLTLGSLGARFTLTCPDDGLATYRATRPPPDVVVIAKRCPEAQALRRAGARLVEAPTIYDAIESLASRT